LGISSYLPLITHLRTLLKKKRKKSYTISVGKLNPAKLGNFMEIEAWVLVACPENSLIDSKVGAPLSKTIQFKVIDDFSPGISQPYRDPIRIGAYAAR
jgi:hypothetical protein